MTNSPVCSWAVSRLLTWIRVERHVRDRLHFGCARPFVPKSLRYEPEHGSIVLSHFGRCTEDAEEDDCVADEKPFIPLHCEHRPRVGAPYAGWCLKDRTERCPGSRSACTVVHVLPADISVIQGGLFALQNAGDSSDEEHGEIKKCVQASNNHESAVFTICDISTARQEFVHLFSMSQECTKCQSWAIKSSQIIGIVTMRELTGKNYTSQTGYGRGGVVDYITHIAVDSGAAS